MKLMTKILAAFSALALASSAMAAGGTVYLTGSTAFRTEVETLLVTAPGASSVGGISGTGGVFSAITGIDSIGAPVGATFVNVTGTIGGNTITIKCAFTGSAGGIFLVGNKNVTPTANAPTQSFVATGAGLSATSANQTDVHTCDITFSDAFQGSCGLALRPSQNTHALVTPSLTGDDSLAVITFKWMGNYSLANPVATGAHITNITGQMVQALFGGPAQTTVAVMAGSTATIDQQSLVFAIGRDFDSGTRIGAFADSGNGITTIPNQWQPFLGDAAETPSLTVFVGTPSAGPVNGQKYCTSLQAWNNSVDYNIFGGILKVDAGNGNGGFNSGGDIAKTLRCSTNDADTAGNSLANVAGVSAAYLVSYLGTADAATTLEPASATAIPGASMSTGSFTMTATSTAGIVQGVPVTGTGIPSNTFIIGVIDSTHLLLSQAATATVSAATITGGPAIGFGPGIELAYNGVKFSPQAIQQGQYSFWGYEHLLHNSNDAVSPTGTTPISIVFEAIDGAVKSAVDPILAGAGLQVASMQVNRTKDGGPIAFTYTP